ncbi:MULTISPECIES: thioredoxin-dependent thiol peroxidase [Corynebacterium]|uniref:thioredoxin-dependent peroxiredoxin n=1 Tax=Corynebacterium hadale TaxID=2026255 RepID=A0A269PHM4_9CORY|nr:MULTISPECIES: thioredoxin-dependent thiol peroxidase [Corynebacterium]MCG7254028.1 thioredoxin-dependent thiol peroxidase [Corynebacterium hadale]MCG7257310.1 thioredoxin-dependent thiol peroxidase [Corynebacterium hadale]MCG7266051.1 thioredoxin-dependent thiol peroxidase [Corynebacterium hadale]PAJ70913.1 thioredoxin-dependent thiol peroxidase [Corynebacterium hadale]PAT04159.1 thioredoxin-dependent thiol peroxidase [Corynebacterium sp. NML 150383]
MNDQIRLEKGDTAPAFTLTNDKGEQVSLSDFAGKRVIVYFYPRANTPGCTTEACDFTEKLEDFNNASVTVLGISPDPTDKLADFRAKHDLGIELLGDESKDTLIAYGAFGEKKMYGKVTEGVIRSTFLVNVAEDGTGTIEEAKYNVRASGHVDRILRDWDI